MFSFLFKKKNKPFVAIADGVVCKLDQVPDEVFAGRMAGDGVAIDVQGNTIVAPCDGSLEMIFPTKHAFMIKTEKGHEVLVHVGINTVSLNGEHFETLIEAGQQIKAGTPILKIDRNAIAEKGISLMTPVLVTNPQEYTLKELNIGQACQAGKTEVLEA
ncbi:MAG: PTS sugar transporter subunit IIA [Bacilli bacterium]